MTANYSYAARVKNGVWWRAFEREELDFPLAGYRAELQRRLFEMIWLNSKVPKVAR